MEKRYQSIPITFTKDTVGSVVHNVQVIGDVKYVTGIAIIKVEQKSTIKDPDEPDITSSDIDMMTMSISKDTGLVIAPVPVHFFIQDINAILPPKLLPTNFECLNKNLNLNFEIAKPILANITYDIVLELSNTPRTIEPYQFQNILVPVTSASLQTQTYNLNSEYNQINGIWIKPLKIVTVGYETTYKIKSISHYIEIRTFSHELILDTTNIKIFEQIQFDLLKKFFPFHYNIKQKSIYFNIEQPVERDPYAYLDIVFLLGNKKNNVPAETGNSNNKK